LVYRGTYRVYKETFYLKKITSKKWLGTLKCKTLGMMSAQANPLLHSIAAIAFVYSGGLSILGKLTECSTRVLTFYTRHKFHLFHPQALCKYSYIDRLPGVSMTWILQRMFTEPKPKIIIKLRMTYYSLNIIKNIFFNSSSLNM
jgi:hypothetical protein